MAITYTVHSVANGLDTTVPTGAITPMSGSDRGLFAIVQCFDGSLGTTVSDVKWDTGGANVSLTSTVSADNSASNRTRLVEFWKLAGTDPGTTEKNWSVTFSAEVNNYQIIWVSLAGVHQTDFEDAVSASDVTGSDTNTEVSITTVDATTLIFVASNIAANTSHTAITDTTEEFDGTVDSGPFTATGFVGSRAVTSATSYTVGSDTAGSGQWSCCAMSIKEAGGAPATAIQDIIGRGIIPTAR